MAIEAGAVINGGSCTSCTWRSEQGYWSDGRCSSEIRWKGRHTYGYPVIPAGQDYEQLVITIHEDGSLTEKFEQDIPAHVRTVATQLYYKAICSSSSWKGS